jgi:hypothetical protein
MENLHPRIVWENEDTRTPWRKWTSYARLELSYCLPAQVISMMSNTANSFCPPPLVVRFYRLGLARDDRAVLGTSYRRHGKHQQMN